MPMLLPPLPEERQPACPAGSWHDGDPWAGKEAGKSAYLVTVDLFQCFEHLRLGDAGLLLPHRHDGCRGGKHKIRFVGAAQAGASFTLHSLTPGPICSCRARLLDQTALARQLCRMAAAAAAAAPASSTNMSADDAPRGAAAAARTALVQEVQI